jgi:hypothetical protein
VGSGLANAYDPIGVYSIEELIKGDTGEGADLDEVTSEIEEMRGSRPNTIAEIMAWARDRIAEIAGVAPGAVKLDLRLET